MASVIWILSVVLYAEFMCAVSAKKLVFLDCQDENHGVHGKDSLLTCFLNSGGKSLRVTSATWRRPGEKRPLIMFKNDKVREPEDPRFSFKQLQMSGSNIDVSFLVRNTLWTDEGKYECGVVTHSGEAKAVVSLSVTGLLSLDCQDENHGVHGKDSLLRCFLNSGGESVMVTAATWRRPGEKRPLIMFINDKVREPQDPRFSFKQLQMSGSNIDVSFLVRNTLRTDEGKYECEVVTDSGEAKAVVSLSVTATYSKPDISSVPEKDLQEGMEVTLFCTASGGYPVGMIRWYDQHGTDWTPSAEMTVVETKDYCINLSSKVTLKASSITPQYRCLVLNNNGVEEGKAEFDLKFQEKAPGKAAGDRGSTGDKGSTAIVVIFVIAGSLLCGLLILALLHRQRIQRVMYPEGSDMKEEGFLKKGVQAMQWITISSCSTSSAGLNKSRSMEIPPLF